MANPRHLPNAPITEAVVDFRAQTNLDASLECLGSLPSDLASAYPQREELNHFELQVEQREGAKLKTTETGGFVGYRFWSQDRRYAAQFRKNGFTFSRLAPYSDWDTVYGEAIRLFSAYVSRCSVSEITRIAVRYINLLKLPEAEVSDFSPFLVAPPPFPQEVNAYLSEFLTKVIIADPDSQIRANVIQTIHRGVQIPGVVPVILDIDVYEQGNLPVDVTLLDERFRALRSMKNRLFFASITEKAAKLFE